MPNRLAHETSPYLLQHQGNPVDWYPWGPEALERAKREDKPIFLSIGYSACHWCHVMEHESFENAAIAEKLNTSFVSIKVDREERPDLDQLYMNAVQMLTGRGGWPMSVFLTPKLKPFYGGTYWPPHAKHGMPGFDQILDAVSAAWTNNRVAADEAAENLTEELVKSVQQPNTTGEPEANLIQSAILQLARSYDRMYGGFGGAPKFPAPMSLRLLLRHGIRAHDASAVDMVRGTLDHMAAGGIYDHLGGGFARYSVDARWLVPHFEKMLYDNSQLAVAYLEAFQVTGKEQYSQTVRETLDYVLRDMTDPVGGFYSTEDADSEGIEGKFYTWKKSEIIDVLGVEAGETFALVYDASEEGNFEHANILNLPKTFEQQAALLGRPPAELGQELAASRAKLFEVRRGRIHPHKDDKVLVAWNGLMIEALALAGGALTEPRYLDAARKAAGFLSTDLRQSDGRLFHTWRKGKAKVDGYLDDYAYLACGLIALYEATFDARYLDQAIQLVDTVLERFGDSKAGGFFYTADDQETLLVRIKEFADNAVPNANAMATMALLKLGKLTGRERYVEAATKTLEASVPLIERYPSACGQMLLALDFWLGPSYEIVLAGDLAQPEVQQVRNDISRRFFPSKVLAYASDNPSPWLEALIVGKSPLGDAPTLYVCEGFTCQAPARGQEEIAHALDNLLPQGEFQGEN